MAYSTILIIYNINIVAFKITSFPISIVYRVRAVSFKITRPTIAVIKLRSFFKRIIGVYIASR